MKLRRVLRKIVGVFLSYWILLVGWGFAAALLYGMGCVLWAAILLPPAMVCVGIGVLWLVLAGSKKGQELLDE